MRREEIHEGFREPSVPDELADLREGDVLCDRHRRECYQVSGIDETGIGLKQDGEDFYIPSPLFVSWYGQRLFAIEESRSIETPEWCLKRPLNRASSADRSLNRTGFRPRHATSRSVRVE